MKIDFSPEAKLPDKFSNMATPRERFAEALNFLKGLQNQGIVGIHSNDIPKVKHRQLLVKNGFLREVTKGWYIATDPNEKDGETTAWYSSYWEYRTVSSPKIW